MDNNNPSKNKNLRAPRAKFHDYRSAGYYFITITTHKGVPPLSIINDKDDDLRQAGAVLTPDYTPLGECVRTELIGIHRNYPQLQVRHFVIMPDHIHFVLLAKTYLDKPLGRYLATFTMACSRAYNKLYALPSFATLFQPFDDRIVMEYEHLSRAIKYIIDNPRRHLIRRKYPDLFRRHLHLTIGEHEYAAYGNIFLLKEMWLLPIRIHRRWTPEEFDNYAAACREKIAEGAIPITPAIHKAEKEIVRGAIDMGSRVILIRDLGFNERFKPQGALFDLCASGRLLLLAPWPDNQRRRSDSGSNEFHQMNDHAATIAFQSATTRLILNG